MFQKIKTIYTYTSFLSGPAQIRLKVFIVKGYFDTA